LKPVKLVITSGGSALAEAIQARLQVTPDATVVTFDGDATDAEACAAAVDGADILIDLRPVLSIDDAPDAGAGDNPASWREAGQHMERLCRGTYVLIRAAATAGVARVVLASSLRHLEEYDPSWSVAESWRPRPALDDPAALGAYLAEETARQLALVEPIAVACVRLARIGADGEHVAWDKVHLEDAASACVLAATATLGASEPYARPVVATGWWVFHAPGEGAHARFPIGAARGIGYAPTHACAPRPADHAHAPRHTPRVASRVVRRLTVFGAGGPLGSAAAPHLQSAYVTRLTDARPLAAIRDAATPQSPGAPLPVVPDAPHEATTCDVTDPVQVWHALEGADALLNLTVIRHEVVGAFRVNFEGAWYVARAAIGHGIRRAIHTGPALNLHDRPSGYGHEFGVPDDAPPRSGTWQYTVSKYLGQEVARIAAEEYDLETPTLVFCAFVNPDVAEPSPGGPHPMSISWDDSGRALRHAVDVPGYPHPFDLIHVTADLPHGRYSNEKARRLLGWVPRDNLEHLYRR
jgi:nucleoside-diphosphate-sugar epimerase